MYEQVSHSLLNEILHELKPEIGNLRLRHFYTRLGANFYAIHTLFKLLYGERADVKQQMVSLVETLAQRYIERVPALRKSDLAREKDYNWFLSQKWVGMALYCDRFADDLKGLRANLPYLQDLGVNLLHVMPLLDCPPDNSDGGYAVRDFYRIDPRFGRNEDVVELAATLKKRDMLLALDVVVNHTSNEHEWARRARQGDKKYQDYYYVFDDRETPDIYEETLPEIFPETAPGNFTWDAEMGKWVMTVFNTYQWDLNYRNPAVLIEMSSISRGLPFGENPKTGDARISGSLASLVGLETALESGDAAAIDAAIKTIVLLHSVILSFGGIPLLYYGDAVGTLNSLEYLADPAKADDNRWMNRSNFNWSKAERRHQNGTVEQRIFSALKKMIALRKEISAFADFDNRQLLAVDNPNLLVFSRNEPQNSRNRVLVLVNFNDAAQTLSAGALRPYGFFLADGMKDVCSGERVEPTADRLVLPPLACLWLVD